VVLPQICRISLASKAQEKLIKIINRKLIYRKRNIKINTNTGKAGQYNDIDDGYEKKKLSERWNTYL